MHEVLVNRLGGLSLPRKSVVRLTDRPEITLNVYRGRKTKTQQHLKPLIFHLDIEVATKFKVAQKRLIIHWLVHKIGKSRHFLKLLKLSNEVH